MFHKIKLKSYLLTIFSILIVLAGVIALSGILGLQNTKQSTDLLVKQILEANSAVKECRIAANTAGRNLREMVLAENPQEIAAFESSINDNIEIIEEQIQIFKDTHGTDAAFHDVAEASQHILDMVAKIAQASREQADSISQISLGIDQISAVVQTNSATSQESAAASEQLSSQANVMNNLISSFQITHQPG